jgi:hypothetical protein
MTMLHHQGSHKFILNHILGRSLLKRGPDSSFGIGTGYGLDGPEIESRWGRDFLHLSRPALHPASCTMGTGSFLEV